MKNILLITLMLLTGAAFSAEVFKAAAPTDFTAPKSVTKTDEGMSISGGYTILFGKKRFKVDSTQKYRISADFRVKGPRVQALYMGFACYDAKRRTITAVSINGIPKSQTVLAAAAKKGDTVLKIKDASAWKNDKNIAVALGAKADFSDMPNRTILDLKNMSLKKEGDVWTVVLAKPLVRDIASGTPVRQHQYAGSYLYAASRFYLKNSDWVTVSAVIDGKEKGIRSDKKFWPATMEAAPLLLLSNRSGNTTLEFRNFKVETVK